MKDTPASAAPPILVAEDDENDAFILRLSFQKTALPNPLTIVPDGRDVVNYLKGEGAYADRAAHPLPCLLLLDLKMPYMNGFDVLEWLSQQSQFNILPVVVLSSSSHEADMQKARQMGASDYYVKPIGLEQSAELIQKLMDRWVPWRSASQPGRQRGGN